MTPITIIVDETLASQFVFSPDLNKVLQIYLLAASDLNIQIAAAQARIAQDQNTIALLTPVASQKPPA